MDTGFPRKIPPPIDQSCVGYWKFNDASVTVKDYSGNGNHGTIVPTWRSDWLNLGCCLTSDIGATFLGDKIYIFARDSGGTIWTQNYNGNIWSGWISLGGYYAGNPSTVTLSNNVIYIFTRGTDNAVWYNNLNGSTWSGWISLGGVIKGDIAITSYGSNMTIAVCGNDDALWINNWNGSTWSNYQPLYGSIYGNAAITSSSNSDITVFVRGWDNAAWTRKWDGSTWSSYFSLGGTIASDISVVSYGSNITILARFTDNTVRYNNWNGSAWSGWISLIGAASSNVAVISSSNGITIFQRAADNVIYTKSWNSSTWSSNWESLGGTFSTNVCTASSIKKINIFAGKSDGTIWTRTLGYTTVPGKFGNAIDLNGTNYIICGHTNVPSGPADRTLLAWVFLNNYNSYNVMIGYGEGTTGRACTIFTQQYSGYIGFSTWGNDNVSGQIIGLSQWHHIAAILTGSTSKIYYDGVLVSTKSDHSAINTLLADVGIGAAPYLIGIIPTEVDGKIDDARIYNRALTALEIKRHYMAGR